MNAAEPDPDRSESLDSILVEFHSDAIEIHSTPRPVRRETLRHLPSHLRDSLAQRGFAIPHPAEERNLAECLLEQAMLLKTLKRFVDAAPRAAEAAALFEQNRDYPRVADCFRIAADIHREMGEVEIALEFRRREEELRRRFAA